MNEENTQNIESTETEAPVTPVAPEPGSAEYNARMAAEGATALGDVPDKFKNEDGTVNMEAFTQSYMELEKQFHAPKEETVVEEASNTETSDGPDAVVDELRVPDVESADDVVTEAANVGITKEDLGSMTAELMKTGEINSDQRASLNAKGVDDVVIDAVVEGQKARMRAQYATASEYVGGSERLSKIFGWAAHNLDENQRAHINAGLAGDASEITLRGLASMYDKAIQSDPASMEMRSSVKPSQNPAGREVVQGFSTKAEYYESYETLLKNPHDTKLRGQIEERMQLTDWSIIQ
tara:strand:- start:9894 stop:10778 length:885 start_codon:yes stop_codon:yes gene_type:complete